jgi:hypothetical protein
MAREAAVSKSTVQRVWNHKKLSHIGWRLLKSPMIRTLKRNFGECRSFSVLVGDFQMRQQFLGKFIKGAHPIAAMHSALN